jgi:hypothetical protein
MNSSSSRAPAYKHETLSSNPSTTEKKERFGYIWPQNYTYTWTKYHKPNWKLINRLGEFFVNSWPAKDRNPEYKGASYKSVRQVKGYQ